MNEEAKPEQKPGPNEPVAPSIEPKPIYVIEFKGSRKEYYRDPYHLSIAVGSFVIVQVERGEDIGRVVLQVAPDKAAGAKVKPLPILRIASDDELQRDADNRRKEIDARDVCRRMASERGLKMKVVDAEWQFDGNKMTFYFTAEKRVDFRQLVKDLAGVYKTRIELRQIGARDEARRVGGVGVCGYEQCCTMFMKEFEPVTTQLARDQHLSLNPSKISGNCGRLLCCLRYESAFYREATRQFPSVGKEWETSEGTGTVSEIQVLRERMVVRLPDGQRQHVSLEETRHKDRKKGSWFE